MDFHFVDPLISSNIVSEYVLKLTEYQIGARMFDDLFLDWYALLPVGADLHIPRPNPEFNLKLFHVARAMEEYRDIACLISICRCSMANETSKSFIYKMKDFDFIDMQNRPLPTD